MVDISVGIFGVGPMEYDGNVTVCDQTQSADECRGPSWSDFNAAWCTAITEIPL
jgi:hypothetical protein